MEEINENSAGLGQKEAAADIAARGARRRRAARRLALQTVISAAVCAILAFVLISYGGQAEIRAGQQTASVFSGTSGAAVAAGLFLISVLCFVLHYFKKIKDIG